MYRWCSKCSKEVNIKQIRCNTCKRETDIELNVGDTLRIDSKREFEIIQQLSHFNDAGMSAVYMATRKDKPEMRGAIKVAKLNKEMALKREAEILQQLQHNHIIRLIHPERALWRDYKDNTILHFFALEYMGGGTLKDRLRQQDRLSLDEAVRITLAIGWALEYAHGHNIAHLDVKPSNILFSTNGRVVLSDFGIARTHIK